MELVDKSKPDSPKTFSRSQYELSQEVGVQNKSLQKIWNILERKGIVRARVGKESTKDRDLKWSLYHDYLARAVLFMRQKEERWQHLLVDGLG